jgi:hypothetical protein
MAALQGLSGLYSDPQDTTDVMDEGVLEARANPPDSDHQEYGVQYLGYSGSVPTESPFGPLAVYDGWDSGDAAAFGPTQSTQYGMRGYGEGYDETPTTHASPSPRIGLSSMLSWDNPNGAAEVGIQGTELHGPDLGGVEFNLLHDPTGREEVTNYTTNNYVAPNENYLAEDIPGQLKSASAVAMGGGAGAGGSHTGGGGGGSNADTTQGYGVLNTMPEFNSGHSIRREQHDRMPWDFTATHGEQDVPFMGRHPVQQMPLDGPDSPYFEMGDIDGANVPWEGRIGDPTAYLQPSEPTISPQPLPQADYYPALAF